MKSTENLTYKASSYGESLDLTSYNKSLKNNAMVASFVDTGGIIINQLNSDDTIGELVATITSYGNTYILIKNVPSKKDVIWSLYEFISLVIDENRAYFDLPKRNGDEASQAIAAMRQYSVHVSDTRVAIENDGFTIKVVTQPTDETPSELLIEFLNNGSAQLNINALIYDFMMAKNN